MRQRRLHDGRLRLEQQQARALRDIADALARGAQLPPPDAGAGEAPNLDDDAAADPQSRALGLLAAHPDWSDAAIAKAAGVSRTSIYRWPRYVTAREALRSAGRSKMPRGVRRREDGAIDGMSDDD